MATEHEVANLRSKLKTSGEVVSILSHRAEKLEEAIRSALNESSWPLVKKILRDALKQ